MCDEGIVWPNKPLEFDPESGPPSRGNLDALVDASPLLTPREKDLVERLGVAWNEMREVVGVGPASEQDLREAGFYIHALQRMVLGNCAARGKGDREVRGRVFNAEIAEALRRREEDAMSRSGYVDELEVLDFGRWRGIVASAIRGKRGQRLLKELVAAMEAMPNKALISEALEWEGQHCALGVVGAARGIEMGSIDPFCEYEVANAFDIAPALAQEIAYINDEGTYRAETPEQRWERVYAWAKSKIAKNATTKDTEDTKGEGHE